MFVYIDTQKLSNTFRPIGEWMKFLKFIVTYLYFTKYKKIKYFIQLYKSMFCKQDRTTDKWSFEGGNVSRMRYIIFHFYGGLEKRSLLEDYCDEKSFPFLRIMVV